MGGLAAEWLCLLPMLGYRAREWLLAIRMFVYNNKLRQKTTCHVCKPDHYGVTCILFSPCIISELVSLTTSRYGNLLWRDTQGTLLMGDSPVFA